MHTSWLKWKTPRLRSAQAGRLKRTLDGTLGQRATAWSLSNQSLHRQCFAAANLDRQPI